MNVNCTIDDCGHGPMATPGEVHTHVRDQHPEVRIRDLRTITEPVDE